DVELLVDIHCTSRLGRHEDDAVATGLPIEHRGAQALQDADLRDVLRVEVEETAGGSGIPFVGVAVGRRFAAERHAVNDAKRLGCPGYGRIAASDDVGPGPRKGAGGGDVDAGPLAP